MSDKYFMLKEKIDEDKSVREREKYNFYKEE